MEQRVQIARKKVYENIETNHSFCVCSQSGSKIIAKRRVYGSRFFTYSVIVGGVVILAPTIALFSNYYYTTIIPNNPPGTARAYSLMASLLTVFGFSVIVYLYTIAISRYDILTIIKSGPGDFHGELELYNFATVFFQLDCSHPKRELEWFAIIPFFRQTARVSLVNVSVPPGVKNVRKNYLYLRISSYQYHKFFEN